MQRLALDNLELGALDSGFAICIQLRPWSLERRRPLERWTSEPRTLCMGTLSLGTLQVWTLDGPELAALEPQSPCSVQALWLRALGLEALTLWTLGPLDLAALGLGWLLAWGSGVWICNVHSAPALELRAPPPLWGS